MRKLFLKKIIPESSYQDAETLLINAKAGLKIVDDQIKQSTIRAPFSGRMTKKLSETGEVVNPGMPVAVLTQMDPILVRAAVPDNLISRIHLLYLGLGATVFGFIIFYQGIREIGPVKTGLFINLVPVFAVILSVIFLHEQVTIPLILGAVLVITGVYLTNRPTA